MNKFVVDDADCGGVNVYLDLEFVNPFDLEVLLNNMAYTLEEIAKCDTEVVDFGAVRLLIDGDVFNRIKKITMGFIGHVRQP
jgi:hypothetical protein